MVKFARSVLKFIESGILITALVDLLIELTLG